MIDKLDGQSLDVVKENVEKLKELFPSIVKEDKIDFDELELLLGENINRSNEQYSFTWNGKTEATKLAQKRSTGTLRPCKEESKDWDTTQNLYIEGDNLEVLRLLQASYNGRIKMIYIDPPYNTGHDFVYKDNFEDNIKNYKEQTGQAVKSNADTDGRYHTNWLNMMYPRLKLARNLLTDDGVIFISIDDKEVANLIKICNEIFGEGNFLNDIVWNSTKSVTNTALISVAHNHTLVYFKKKQYYVENREFFRLIDSGEGFENPDNDPRGPWKADPFQVGGWRPNQQYEIINPKTGSIYKPNPGCSWKNDYNKYLELVKDNRIVFGKTGEGGPQRKRFIWEASERGKVSTTLWTDVETTTNGTQQIKKLFNDKAPFSNPKPIGLIKRILELGSDKNSIVIDFFSGSSTTAHAVMEMNLDGKNRKFIMVQFPENLDKSLEEATNDNKQTILNAIEVCDEINVPHALTEVAKERIRRAGEKIRDENPDKQIDIGFKVFKLDSSNLKKWDNTPTKDVDAIKDRIQSSIDYLKDDRTELDLVYEVMLKYGIDLSYPIKQTENKKAYIVEAPEYKLLVCTQPNLTLENIESFANESVGTYLFADRCFNTDNLLINTEEILKSRNKEMRLF
ncbi:MAG TPA: site-specific DNA-methyltransferase [Candidatus Caccovivens faecavium]|nr:site-specific DNA-methyltransferase [Candidatus Caccovivens faecavium]